MNGRDAAVVRDALGFALDESPRRAPGPDDVVFAMRHASICGTDRQIAAGVRADRARVLGHEGVATVVQAPAGAPEWPVGSDHVFLPVNPADQDEILGHSTDGLFCRRFVIAAAELRRRALTVPVPAGLRRERCVLAEPLATVVYTHELLAATMGHVRRLLIVGSGAMGSLHATYAHAIANVGDVAVATRRADRAAWLRDRGAVPAAVRTFAGTNGDRADAEPLVDAVVCCVPASSAEAALRLAIERVAPNGCIAIVNGVPRSRLAALDVDLAALRRANACGTATAGSVVTATTASGKPVRVFGHRGCAVRHVVAALAALAREPRFARILTHRIALPSLPRVLTEVATNARLLGTEYGKGLVDCEAAGPAVAALGPEELQ